MTITAGALRELHRIHQQLSDLGERLDRGPKQIHAREKSVAHLEAELAKEEESYQQIRMLTDKKQLDLKSSENKVADLKAKLNACSSNKEYQLLLDQIAATEMAASVLSDEILEGLEQIDELAAEVSEAKKKVAAGQQDLQKHTSQVTETSETIRADITRLEADLQTAESALPSDFRVDYDRIVRAKRGDALAPMEGGYCSGCSQRLTTNVQVNLSMGRPIFCQGCGRLLYMAEDGSVDDS